MHIERPATDQHLDITLSVNNQPATEYVLPTTVASDGYIDTYIAVNPGDYLTVKWCFTGSILHGKFDLVADGTLCRESRIEGDSVAGVVKYVKRHHTWSTGLDCPTSEDWTSSEPPPHVYEGSFVVAQSVGHETSQDMAGGDRPGVGSLVVVASVNQNTLDNYHDPQKSIQMGSWRSRKGEEVRQAEISPEYALELRLLSDDKVASRRSLQHRKSWQQTRFGNKPWGKFCFYYRSLESIQRAGGMVRRDDKVLQVEAWSGKREFVFAEPPKKSSKRKITTVAGDDEGEDGVMTPEWDVKIKQERQESELSEQTINPKPKKKAKLGGSLFGSAETQPKEDLLVATEGRDEDRDAASNDDNAPTSSELAAVHDDDPFKIDHLDAAPANSPSKRLDYFNQKRSEVSISAPVQNATPTWSFPSAASRHHVQKPSHTSESAQKANAAHVTPALNSSSSKKISKPLANAPTLVDASALNSDMTPAVEPNLDGVKLPTNTEIRSAIDDDVGISLIELDEMFDEHGPYGDPAAARVEFDRKVSSVAEQRSDGNFYIRSDENISRAQMARTAATAKTSAKGASDASPAPKASPANKAGKKSKVAQRPKAAAKRHSPGDMKHQPIRRREPAATSKQAAYTLKRKPPTQFSPSGPTTPSSRTLSATPTEVGVSSAVARKEKLATLRKELASKQAREREAKKQVQRDEAKILEIQRAIQDADRRWIEEFDSGRIVDDAEIDGDDMKDEDGDDGDYENDTDGKVNVDNDDGMDSTGDDDDDDFVDED